MKPLIKYLARRFAASVLILLGVVTITFCLIYIFPADPVRQVAGHNATPETVASIRHEMGLDLPLHAQYLHYMTHLLQGDLGRSYIQKS
jgi:peptide/nickel transport system permease protein